MKNEYIIKMTQANKWFGEFQVLKSIDLKVLSGSRIVICGPSGSGKSTILRCIVGLEQIQSGSIQVMGQELNRKILASASFRANIGMVFQRFSLYPHMSVLNNLKLAPRKVRGLSDLEAEDRARKMLERVGLLDKINAFPSELSGGQQQRISIARALVMEPKIMLFDEPTSALDPEMIREVLDVIRDLAHSGMTLVVVTHEIGFAREVADEVVFVDEGRIVETGKVDTFFTSPRTERLKHFLNKVLYH